MEKLSTDEIVKLAIRYSENGAFHQASAIFCCNDALDAQQKKNDDQARFWAIRSLKYSIGLSHPDYQRATAN